MTGIVQGFCGARLTEARKASGKSATDLAELAGVSVQSISKYENGHQNPKFDVFHKLVSILNVPRDYFFRPVPGKDERPIFWRARLTAPPTARDRAEVRLEWMKEIVDYLENYFDLPELNIPKIEFHEENIADMDFVESTAKEMREFWGIKPGPMPDTIEKLETNGILVSRIHVNADKLDAFSQWSDTFNMPFVVLSRDKASACRQRFDVLHELVHICCHNNVPQRRLNDRAFYKLIEKQADRIASAMLLPEYEFTSELYAPSLDGFLTLKERWGASVASMIMRCKGLDIIDEDQATRLWINYNRRGWRKSEPLDNKMKKEDPQLIRRSFEMLVEEGVQSHDEISRSLPFPPKDLEELSDLPPGTFRNAPEARAEPILKEQFRRETLPGTNVVSFPGKKT
ncbi:helix-turn-helix domain-containing protein [Methylocystis heyeri]|uniref:ImmA/IrrE family metallo-endopeptidase n=1 Tax=Methylocystis heyeri TaxID=391905 RepID=A0A6B8KIZ4_9HYPH|nr:XRE family transcriptional regulator [Methylocystis heyeri]QGM46508.1 ImmA/IrrE family metallo-endopeptidase [Methylocystis heyeri]